MIKKYPLDKKYLLALSGGPDSMALLHMLSTLNYSLVVCFVNYHFRNNVDKEQKMVEEYVKKLNYTLEIKHAYYQKKYGNFENWARNVRYEFFYEMNLKYNTAGCFVAHHQDDLLETYYLQKERGYVSFYGLKEESIIKNVKILRPILHQSKEFLLRYCLENKIPYSIDYTNNDLRYKRNYIRYKIVKNLSFSQKKEILEEIDKRNSIIEKINKRIDILLENKTLLYSDFINLKAEEQDRLIYRLCEKVYQEPLSIKRINDIKNKLKKDGNVIIDFENNYQLIKEYNSLNLVKKEMYNYCIVVEKPTIVENDYIKFDLLTDPNKFFIKPDSYPLIIKNVEKNKKIQIGSIHKSINRLMIDEKIPYLKRLYWPEIVNNKGEIIFVPRQDKDENGLFIVKNKKNMI